MARSQLSCDDDEERRIYVEPAVVPSFLNFFMYRANLMGDIGNFGPFTDQIKERIWLLRMSQTVAEVYWIGTLTDSK
jgi:hypothetical protein